MSPTTNRAFWQDKAGVPGTIREGPIPSTLSDSQILIKVRAWGTNPVDAFLQDIALPFLTYPLIPGEDVAGVVERVGAGEAASRRFRPGDRVLAYALGGTSLAPAENGGFQEYVRAEQAVAVKIPDALSFVEAAVFPLCMATAAHALFSPDYLGLPYPKAGGSAPARSGKTLLVWGGASGVGNNAIQMATAAGFDVVTTCSPRNFELVRSLGAVKAFDYTSATVVDDLVAELGRGACAGIFQAAGQQGQAIGPCCQVAHRLAQKPLVACANFVPDDEGVVPPGVEARFVFGGDAGKGVYYDTTSVVFPDFLEEALRLGTYKVAPRPEVVPTKGLEGVQEALGIVRKGLQAKKIIVEAE